MISLVVIQMLTSGLFAQQPISWDYSAKKIADKTYELHIRATINAGWHIYAQHQPDDAISLPTSIEFIKNPLLVFSGGVKELGQMEKHKVEALDIEQNQYSGKVDFVQVVRLKGNIKTSVNGSTKYQVCTDERCLPPATISFQIQLNEEK